MKPHRVVIGNATLILSCGLFVNFSEGQELTNRDIVERAGPAVVVVQTFDALGRPLSQGSGFFVDDEGRVATNFHVLTGAKTATVTLASGRSMEVIGFLEASPAEDVVVLYVGRTPGVFLTVSDTVDVKPGDDVVVIGAPLGFGQTVTSGTVSGYVSRDQMELLRFSAPISSGSSGSPVLDSHALVVGMVVRGIEGAVQLSFAIPASVLKPLIETRDSVLPLTELPVPTEPVTVEATSGRPPAGITGFYRFTTLRGYDFVYIWIVENPGGQISGAVFIQHETGFMDVVPLRRGKRPGRRRDFELQVGCVVFDGWIRDDGDLAGDVLDDCEQDKITPFLATSVVSDPEQTNPLEGVKLFRVGSDGTLDDPVGAWVVLVGPKDLGEGTVASLHLWGEIPGGAKRRDVVLPRGEADIRTASFETVDRSIKLTVEEAQGRVEVHIFDGTDAEPVLRLRGFRSDLIFCFSVADSAQWRRRVDSIIIPDSLKIYADSLDQVRSQLNDVLVQLGERTRRGRMNIIWSLEEKRALTGVRAMLEDAEKQIPTERERLQRELEVLRARLENIWRCPP